MLDRFHKLSEIVAAFAIVGSLIFVGLQMQQNTDAMRVSFIQSSMESWNLHSMTMASDERLLSEFFSGVYPELQQKFGKIDPVEGQVSVWMTATWHTVETLFFQWQAGYLSDEHWQGLVRQFPQKR